MSETIKFNIPGEPIAWKRPAGMKIRYDSQKAEKETVRLHFLAQLRKQHRVPLKYNIDSHHEVFDVQMRFYLSAPQSSPLSERNAKFWGLSPANEKPDCDNLAKFYLDCGNGLLWTDDKRIRSLYTKKFYSENPRTIIEIMANNKFSVPPAVEGVLRVFGPNKLKEFANHVKKLSYLDEEKINSSLEGCEGGFGQQEGRWLAWTALLLVDFAKSHAVDLKNILKYSDIDIQLKQTDFKVENDKRN